MAVEVSGIVRLARRLTDLRQPNLTHMRQLASHSCERGKQFGCDAGTDRGPSKRADVAGPAGSDGE
jgi:hypothetical protein